MKKTQKQKAVSMLEKRLRTNGIANNTIDSYNATYIMGMRDSFDSDMAYHIRVENEKLAISLMESLEKKGYTRVSLISVPKHNDIISCRGAILEDLTHTIIFKLTLTRPSQYVIEQHAEISIVQKEK